MFVCYDDIRGDTRLERSKLQQQTMNDGKEQQSRAFLVDAQKGMIHMKKSIYEEKSLTKLIFIFGIPSMLSLMMEMLTGIVDTAFAGNLPEIGDYALSAMALISPILAIFIAVQTLFAMSTGILIARYLNDAERQNTSYTTGVVMSIAVSMAVSAVCYLMLPWLLSALGAEGQIFLLAKQYLQIQLLSNVLSSVGYTLTCCIRAFGFPKAEVKIITGAVAVNIISNYIFAFVFQMGLSGLAWGTFVSELVCAVGAIAFLVKKKRWLRKERKSAAVFFHSAWELFKIGIAQTAMQVLGSCTGFVINARLLTLGSMLHVAAWNVVQRIYTFVLTPIVGLTQGVQNIISYFSGNGEQEKIRAVSRRTMIWCSAYGFISMLLMMSFGQTFSALFGGGHEIAAIAKTILMIVFLGFPFVGILYTDMTLLQVTGHEFASVLLILSRQVFFLIPMVYLIPALVMLGGFGISPITALLFCMPLADLLSVLFAVLVKRRIAAKIH
ncbi:MAG: MATE family efflux transporter [Clostridia bacterium]